VDYDEKTISAKTQKVVTKDYWQGDHTKQRINDVERANFQKETIKDLKELEDHVLEAFYKVDNPARVNKKWLKNTVETFYNPQAELEAPTELIKFFDFYTDLKKSELSNDRIKRIRVTKNKLKRFEKDKNRTVLISQVNDKFKKDFTEYSDSEQYARSTLNADFSIIKTICRYAEQWSLEVSPQLDNLKATPERIKAPYLSFDEIEVLRSLDLPKDGYLDNARDWLVISCYTGQRISDFLRFTSDMITKDGADYYLEFRQQKTGKLITIPF